MEGTYERDARLSESSAWRITWGRQGWTVVNAQPVPLGRGQRAAIDVVVRYTLRRTPDARYPPGIPN